MTADGSLVKWRRFVTHCTERMMISGSGRMLTDHVGVALVQNDVIAQSLDAVKNDMSASEYLFWNKYVRSKSESNLDLRKRIDVERRRLSQREQRAKDHVDALLGTMPQLKLSYDATSYDQNVFAQVIMSVVDVEALRMELDKVDFVDRFN